ncbi:MAG: tRNA threonylcarbamoyladenosine dehydratase [Clostridia bacterium]|nr:tRNA threonylcarbamoyladenosine dehydratase [Clostridia bacterium]
MTDSARRRLARQISLIGEKATERLISSSVLIAGIGGVGGHAADAIARMGVGRIVLVDNDTVSESNINRQMIATYGTVGRLKTEVMAERIRAINPDCDVLSLPLFITKENASLILAESGADAIIDAVDNVSAKIAMAVAAKEQGRYIFASMGTGNKINSAGFCVADIYSTSGCGLARVMRRELKKRGIESLDVVYSREHFDTQSRQAAEDGARVPASIAYMPAIAGLIAAEQVAKHLISKVSEQ